MSEIDNDALPAQDERQPYPTDSEPNSKDIIKIPAERAVLSTLFGIVLAVKTIYPQAKTDAQRIELLTGVLQALLETFDERGVEMDQGSFAATAMGLSHIVSEEWA